MMLARVAESLYWTARAVERADTYSRLLEVSHAMTLERGGDGRISVWEPLVEITGDLERFLADHRRADERSVAWFLSFSAANPNSILSCLRRARQNAHGVRDLLPTDVWEALNGLYLELRSWPPGRITREGVYPFCRTVRRGSHLIQGLMDQGMRRDASWEFLQLGRHLERAEKSARLLEVKYHLISPPESGTRAPADLHQWRSLLRSFGADETVLRMDGGLGSPAAITHLLVRDAAFPRSVAFCLDMVARCLESLAVADVVRDGAALIGVVAAARGELIAEPAPGGPLADLLDRIQQRCNEIDRAVAAGCFAYPSSPEGSAQRAQAARQAQN